MVKLPSALSDFLHLFFPHICNGCGADTLQHDQHLCIHCLAQLPDTGFFQHAGNPVEETFYGRLPLRHAGAAFFFTKDSLFQHLLFQLKYRGNREIGVYLGKLMGQQLRSSQRFEQVDVIVPLPLNPKKEKRRGYNQATCLSRGIEQAWSRPVVENVAYRKVYTETQTHKGRISRWENMDGVFALRDQAALQGKHVLLVDDVVTTGATLEACGSEILKIPGTTLSIATLAYTI